MEFGPAEEEGNSKEVSGENLGLDRCGGRPKRATRLKGARIRRGCGAAAQRRPSSVSATGSCQRLPRVRPWLA